ncbi:MAG TPA: hypothetical protein VK974_01175 [Methylophilaceae bacterium]|nr:hypothetical protein [Methylophilaceae bacterium]
MRSISTSISSGSSIKIDGVEFLLKQIVDGIWNAENKKTGAYERIDGKDIIKLYGTERLQLGVSASVLNPLANTAGNNPTWTTMDKLPEDTQALVRSRRLFLEHLEKQFGPSPDAKSINFQLAADWSRITKNLEKMPSMQTIRRWLKRYQKSGKNIISLMGRETFRGNTSKRVDEKLEELGLEALHSVYLKPERFTLKLTLSIYKNLVMKENELRNEGDRLKIPTISLLRSLLTKLPPEDVYAARHGINAARAKYRNAVHNLIVDQPFQRYEIDHTQLDIMVVDARTGINLGRPWLTMILDKSCKAITGKSISMEPPSGESLAKAFKHAIMPKNIKSKYPEIINDWDMHGLPILIVCDNGMEFYGKAFFDMCFQLGIRVEFMPRKRPWWKGSIERGMRTINAGVCGVMPGGRTFGSITEKGDYDPVKTSVITLEELEKFINIWIVDIYNQSFHRTIQTSPATKWSTLVDPEDILYPEDPNVFDKITGQIDLRSWMHYGIELNHVVYNSYEFKHLYNQFHTKKRTQKVKVRWSAEDVGQITVILPDDSHIVVPATDRYSYTKGMSLRHYRLTRQDLINRGLDPENEQNVEDAKVRLFYQSQQAGKDGKKRKAQYKRDLAKAEMLTKKHVFKPAETSTNKPVIFDQVFVNPESAEVAVFETRFSR